MSDLQITKSLQSLRKERRTGGGALKDRDASLQGAASPSSAKVDRVAAYMERQFYEQFQPKRDRASRIRKTGKEQRRQHKACAHFKKRVVDDSSGGVDKVIPVKTASSEKRRLHYHGEGMEETDNLKAVWDKVRTLEYGGRRESLSLQFG